MDVEARDDLLDRLRSRLAMLERELKESQRVAQVQVCHTPYRADIRNVLLNQNVLPSKPRKLILTLESVNSKIPLNWLPPPHHLLKRFKRT
jgi:hypothetical protein